MGHVESSYRLDLTAFQTIAVQDALTGDAREQDMTICSIDKRMAPGQVTLDVRREE